MRGKLNTGRRMARAKFNEKMEIIMRVIDTKIAFKAMENCFCINKKLVMRVPGKKIKCMVSEH